MLRTALYVKFVIVMTLLAALFAAAEARCFTSSLQSAQVPESACADSGTREDP